MDHLNEPGLDALAATGDWSAYGRLLVREGCAWWFRMDIPRIEHHLKRLLDHQSAGMSPRLRLLEGIITPMPGAEKLPGILSTLSALHRVLLMKRDVEGAAVCSGLALAAVWDFGADFALARPWLDKVSEHLVRPALPVVARAHLLAFAALFRLFFHGDVAGARELLAPQAEAAAAAECPELTLYGGSVRALTDLFAGEVHRGKVALDDAAPFVPRVSPTSHARVYYELVRGVLLNGTGRPGQALPVLERAAGLLPRAQMPLSMRVQLAGYRLMAAALLRDEPSVARFEAEVRDLAVADRNHLHCAFMHFGLGVALLRKERPYRALIHAQAGERLGERAHSPIPTLLNRVLVGQAFSDLNEVDEAEAAFARVDRDGGGLPFFGAAVAVERAHRALQRGRTDEARELLDVAVPPAVGAGPVRSPFRSPRFNEALHERLRPTGSGWRVDTDCPIRIRTFGEFSIAVDGRRLYDRRWGSRRSQRLLKLLLALGGSKVPVDELSADLWPDASGDRAYANFKTALARLRKVVAVDGAAAPDWVLLKYGRVSLSQALVGVDAFHFRQKVREYRREPDPNGLPALLSLYRGDFLPHDNHSGALARMRRELRQLFVGCVGALVDACAAGAVAVELPAHLARAVDLAPDVERIHVLRIRCLLDAGYRVEARQALVEAETYFRDAHGVAPGAELARLGQEVAREVQG